MKKLMMFGLLAASLLTSCGGSGQTTGTNTPPPTGTSNSPVTQTPQLQKPINTSSVTVTITGTTGTVTWSAVTNAKSYKIDRKTGTGAYTEVGSVDSPSTTFTDKVLAAGTYTYRVRSLNPQGESAGKESAPTIVAAEMATRWIGSINYDNALQIDDLYVDFVPAKSRPSEPPHVLSKLGSSQTWVYQSATDAKYDSSTNDVTIVYRELNDSCKSTTQLVKISAKYDPKTNTIIGTLRSDGIAYSYKGNIKMYPATPAKVPGGGMICVGM